jgi:hypothetical protein
MAKPIKAHSKEKVLKAIIKENGYLHMVAAELKCSEKSVSRYIKDYKLSPFVKEMRDSRHHRMIMKAESGLEKAVGKQEPWAIRFVLERLGKERYSEKQIIEQTNMEVIKPKPIKKEKD